MNARHRQRHQRTPRPLKVTHWSADTGAPAACCQIKPHLIKHRCLSPVRLPLGPYWADPIVSASGSWTGPSLTPPDCRGPGTLRTSNTCHVQQLPPLFVHRHRPGLGGRILHCIAYDGWGKRWIRVVGEKAVSLLKSVMFVCFRHFISTCGNTSSLMLYVESLQRFCSRTSRKDMRLLWWMCLQTIAIHTCVKTQCNPLTF